MKSLAGRKSGLGAGCKFQRDGAGTRRNGGHVDAEWRLSSVVMTSGLQRTFSNPIQETKDWNPIYGDGLAVWICCVRVEKYKDRPIVRNCRIPRQSHHYP